jgi:glycosyltransferase involved in cell wall biosynthesis
MNHAAQQPPRRLRILISDSIRIWGGAQRFIVEAATGLTGRGHGVFIQTFPGSPLAARARSQHLPVHEVAVRTDAAPWIVLPLAWRMRRDPYDVVITTWDKDLRTTGLAAKLAGRDTLVVHTRECDDPLKNTRRYRWFYTRIADHIIVNSRATLKTTLGSAPWLPENRATILYKGIDLRDYEAPNGGPWRERLDAAGSRVIVGYAGQLIARKRIDVLMRLLASPDLAGLPWHLAIAGKGPEEQRLRETARQLGIADRVTFCGFVDDVHRWLAAIDVFVLPSLIEGFGYVLAEAAAAGKPCVAYRASSVPEVVKDGETALLADVGDDAGLAAHVKRLVADADLRARMGAAARRDAFARHGVDTMVQRIETILLRGLDERRNAAREAP